MKSIVTQLRWQMGAESAEDFMCKVLRMLFHTIALTVTIEDFQNFTVETTYLNSVSQLSSQC